MKYYTVKEAAKKLRVSKSHIYALIKRGEIKKKEGMGDVVRIPASELNSKDIESADDGWSKFDKSKVTLIHTSHGNVRRVIDKRAFVAIDIAKILNKSSTHTIKKLVLDETFIHLEPKDAKVYGLRASIKGIELITIQGIKEYLSKAILPSDFDSEVFIEELLEIDKQISIDEVVEEKTIEGNKLLVIDQREVMGKHFKIYGTIENPLFLAKEVAEWIEHSQSIRMIENVDAEEKVMRNVHTLGGNQEAWFLTEDGLYEVLMQSRKPIAKQFKKEVKKILKQIRKTGGYVGNSEKFVDNYFSNLSKETRQTILFELESKNKTLMAERVKIDKELLDNADVIEKIQETLEDSKERE